GGAGGVTRDSWRCHSDPVSGRWRGPGCGRVVVRRRAMESEMKMQLFRVVTTVLLGWVCVAASVAEAQMVIVVRHAERADAGAAAGAAMTASPDPELSAAGKARAQGLAAMLKDVGVAAIYTTEYRRTIDTAQPLADALSVTRTTVS